MVGQGFDWVFEEMVMKVVDVNFEIEEVELVEEDKIVVENMVVGTEDIRDIFHKYFSNLDPKMYFEIVRAKVAMAWVQSNFSVVVHMIEY